LVTAESLTHCLNSDDLNVAGQVASVGCPNTSSSCVVWLSPVWKFLAGVE
jgi:hypothetical protein